MIEPKIELPESTSRARRFAFVGTLAVFAALTGVAVREVGLPAGIHAGFALMWFLVPVLYDRFSGEPLNRRLTEQSYRTGKILLVVYVSFLVLRELL